ncbi:MAG: acyl-CoA thioesterase [Lysobacteraceae bacterium]
MQASRREVTLRFLAEPTDVNFGGKMFGGSVMKWIDLAGFACASGWSGSYCVTAYVGGIGFERPIMIGSLVEAWAQIVLTGNSSMHIAVDVYSRDPRETEWARTTHCLIVFVAVDDDGKPHPVPAWVPETEADRLLADYAEDMKAQAKQMEAKRASWLAPAIPAGSDQPSR